MHFMFLCLVKSIFALLLFLFFLGQTLFFPRTSWAEQWRSPPRLGSAPRPRRADAAGGAGKRQRCGGAAGAEGAAHKRARSLCPWVRCIVLPLGSGCILVACSHYPYYLYIHIYPFGLSIHLPSRHCTRIRTCMHACTHISIRTLHLSLTGAAARAP